jgi:hypothetical protein
MDSDRLYWGALALFGVAGVAEGVSAAAGDPGPGAWLTLLGGLVVVVASVAAVLQEAELSGGADSPLVRGAAIGGALLYAAVTLFELV